MEGDSSKEDHHDVCTTMEIRNHPFKGHYSLVILTASCLVKFLASIIFSGFGVLYVTFSEVFQEPKAVLGWIGSVHTFSHRAVCLLSSVLIERYGSRPVVMAGALIAGIGCAASAFANNVLTLYVTYGILAGAGTGMCVLASTVILPTYFKTNKNLALGISVLGFYVANMCMAPITQGLINNLGWRGSMLIIAGLVMHAMPFGALMKPFNDIIVPGSRNDKGRNFAMEFCEELLDFSLLKNPNACLYAFGNVLCFFGQNTFSHHLSSRGVAYGLNNNVAAMLNTYVSIGLICTPLPLSFLAQWKRTNVILLFALSIIIGGILVITTGLHTGYYYMVAHAVVNGCFIGIYYTTLMMSALKIAGQDHLARLQGITLFFGAIASLLITPAGGWMYDVTGNYNLPFFVMGGIQVLGGLLILAINFRNLDNPTTKCKNDSQIDELECAYTNGTELRNSN